MKRPLGVFVCVLAMVLAGCGRAEAKPDAENHLRAAGEIRGAWVASIWNIDFPSRATTNPDTLKSDIDDIVSKATASNLNALFFQVRPCADALYNSDIFPWSRWLTGAQGVAPSAGFDPLGYFIERAHAQEIQLHAWINPYRVTALETEVLVPVHPAVKWPEITITVNGKVFFNPGSPRARSLVIDGVRELVQNYNLDGIHFDDYFYPEGITDQDRETWLEYGSDFDNIEDWRRACVDELVRGTKDAVKGLKPNMAFGISPTGVWANKSHDPLGSDTRGFESHYAIYADSRGWVKKGYIDYIAPQIYWYRGQPGSDFQTVLDWWREVCKDTSVALYIGLAGYKQGTGGPWNDPEEFAAQQSLARTYADGFIVFSFGDSVQSMGFSDFSQ